MKKIVALFLSLALSFACVLAFASCGEQETAADDNVNNNTVIGGNNTENNESEEEIKDTVNQAGTFATDAAKFITAYGATAPKSYVTTTTVEIDGVTLESVYTVTVGNDGNTTINYISDYIPGINETDDYKQGTIVVNADGDVVSGDEAVYAGFASADLELDLGADITEYAIADNTLVISVDADDTEAVLGADLGYDATVSLIIKDGKVLSIAISYDSETASNKIVTLIMG